MYKLDNQFLEDVGLGNLPAAEKPAMLKHIYDELEKRVGERLASQMTEQQLRDFEGFVDSKDEAGALNWLETNLPNYRDVVADELAKIREEVKESAPHIMADSAARARAAAEAHGLVGPQPATAADAPSESAAPAPQQPLDQTDQQLAA